MAVVVTYAYPVAGTTPPTVLQALGENMLTLTISSLDADTIALITHNWQLTTAQLANLWPLIQMYVSGAGTAIPIWSFALTNSVLVTVTKASAAGGGGTVTVVLMRPHSIIT